MINHKTNQPLKFESLDDMKKYLSFCNPTILRGYKEQYTSENPDYHIVGSGKSIEVKKIKKGKR